MKNFKREYMDLCRKRVHFIISTNENRLLTLQKPRLIATVPYDYNMFERERINTCEWIVQGYIVKEGTLV